MAFPARIEAIADPRQSPRTCLRLTISARLGPNQKSVMVHDLSATGLLIETPSRVRLGDEIMVELPECEQAPARVVWSSGAFYGCQFVKPVSPAVVSAAQLKSALEDQPAFFARP